MSFTEKISITGVASISSVGGEWDEIWHNYLQNEHFLEYKEIGTQKSWVGVLSDIDKQKILALRNDDTRYESLDLSVLMAIWVARKAVGQANWKVGDDFGINIGSSRGATDLFEKNHQYFLENNTAQTLSSPTTTLGNISSWVMQDLQTSGPEISHSITCSTALHALLNGVAWIQSGMAQKFLVGGSEAPLTAFTLAQMNAMKIMSQSDRDEKFPCCALDMNKTKNTMVLGEGAAMICLERGVKENAIALIEGVGYGSEKLIHSVSISEEAICFQKSMQMALGKIDPKDIDVIVMHAPGTLIGDTSEMKAIAKVFEGHEPQLTCNKWKIGHTFGASGMLSVHFALMMLEHQKFIGTPLSQNKTTKNQIKKVMINAVGFGGNAVSVVLGIN
jgi:3-oxoacyl-[acyl-carrier-protein] synthase II